jgi:hypothetical protein
MKNSQQILRLLLVAITVTGILSACSGIQDGYIKDGEFITNVNPTALVIIVGRHANAMDIPNDAYRSIETILKNAVYGGYVGIVISDGKPSKVEFVDHSFFAENARNGTILNREINNRVKKLNDTIRDDGMTAVYPENDLLEAIREATNILSVSGVRDIADKRIVIIDTGVTTTGDLNFFQLNFLRSRPNTDDIVRQLKEQEGINVLPDLTGISVTFIGTADGMAEVAAPQRLGTADKKFIRDFWSTVVLACGASEVHYESAAGWSSPNIYTEDYDSRFPFISTVEFDYVPILVMPEIPDPDPNNPDDPPVLPAPPAITVRLGSEMVGFRPEQAEFLNEYNAIETLRPYARDIIRFIDVYSKEKIWIVGTTATTTKGGDGSVDLGLRRAEKVKEILTTEFQIPEDRLLTIGLGAKFPWHVDEFPRGVFDTEVAQANRAVWLMTDNRETEKFNMLRDAYEKSQLLPNATSRFRQLVNG